MTDFSPKIFFTLSDVFFVDLFNGIKDTWDVIPKLHDYLLDQFKSGKVISNYGSDGNIFLGEGTIIEEGAKILGPAIIGKNCFIGHGVFIRGGCLFGDGVKIGHATEVKSSILMNDTSAAHLNYIGDSVVGNNVNIAGGAIFANLRFDGKSVTIRTGTDRIQTTLRKFGSIVGDDSNIGVNTVLNPGTILGKKTVVFPLTSVIGTHEQGATIKNG